MCEIELLGPLQVDQAFRASVCVPIAMGVYPLSHKLLTPTAQVGRP